MILQPATRKFYPLLAVSTAFGILMLLARIWVSGMPYYIFLVWNLFLAWLPLFFSQLLSLPLRTKASFFKEALLFCCWLLFLPNSPYILTDLFHLHNRSSIPIWYDLILVLTFAWTGLLMGLLSMYTVHEKLMRSVGKILAGYAILLVIALTGFGIYLGRFLRWNSWDIVSNPIELFSDIAGMLIHPFQHSQPVGITFSFALFFAICYWTFYLLINFKDHEPNKP